MAERAPLEGKTALVTGSTGGIGHQLAMELAARGAHVIVTGRQPDAVAAAAERIQRTHGSRSASGHAADLSLREGRASLAAAVRSTHPRLDILVNNAGALFTERQLTKDGVERTWALNHVAPFELTQLLLPVLRSSGPARIITVSSQLHAKGVLQFEDLSLASNYSPLRAYAQSKLANVLFTRELARRLTGTQLTANCFHPGMVRSGFGKTNQGLVGRLTALGLSIGQRLFGVDVVAGADTGVFLASAPEVEGVTGGYYDRRVRLEPSPAAQDEQAAVRLWELTEALVTSRGEALG